MQENERLSFRSLNLVEYIVGKPRDPNKANRTIVRQISKFGMIVYYKIVINNLI